MALKLRLFIILSLCGFLSISAQNNTSVAGLFPLADSGRKVYDFNSGWRFHLGDVADAQTTSFDDSSWSIVSTPHSVTLEPAEASGGRNYQGVAWYRKHFRLNSTSPDRYYDLHFEAVMGKQVFYLNGKKIREHEGGYTPVTIHIDKNLIDEDDIVIAVMTDNSNDKSYPPGKPQYALDFAYHGGIYRDVWLIETSPVCITDAVESGQKAGGGIFVHYSDISEKSAVVYVNTELENKSNISQKVSLLTTIRDKNGQVKGYKRSSAVLEPHAKKTEIQKMTILRPDLWSPESPTLYQVETKVTQGRQSLDGGITRIGIRSFEFKGAEGFWLNGKRYHQFVGANRHQDFAYVGNALPNSQQWRDALRLRNAGFTIIRTAHYPQDPSFMDACDELGLFVIVATPGWQYWNKDSLFAVKVQQNTREIIRRDRNHPSVLMWEPILNETRFPESFALEALKVTREEYPYPYRPIAAADMHSAGVKDNYDLVYGWPGDDEAADKPKQCIFTREFGEIVDDWYAHNCMNRASRSWGEKPQLVQAMSHASSCDEMFHTTGQFLGGCLWHPFDHQRGYHPDPYWGGIYDAFRQKKTSYYMFRSQSPASYSNEVVESGPMVYIAHEMTPFSDSDVVVFSNCDSVRLTMYDNAKILTLAVPHQAGHMPNPPVIFKDVWNVLEARDYSYKKKDWQNVKIKAEGIIGGKVVCTHERMPSRRSTKLRLYVDDMGLPLIADGSDFIVVVAEVTDDRGNVRRLAKENIVFTVEGEGEIIGDAQIHANPRPAEWGSAPVLIRSTQKAGKITVHAEVEFPGTHAPESTEITFESRPALFPFCQIEYGSKRQQIEHSTPSNQPSLSSSQKSTLLKEVEQQQSDFGTQK
jgi:beta-galactosidase